MSSNAGRLAHGANAEGVHAGRGRRQNGGGDYTAVHYPWRGEKYADDKSRFFKFVRSNRYHGHPTRLSEAVRVVYGDDYTNTEYRRLSRFAKRSDWIEATSTAGYVEVEPTPECFCRDSLESNSKQTAKTQEGGRVGIDASETGSTAGRGDDASGLGATAGPTAERYPKDRVRQVLEKVVRLDGGQFDQRNDYRQGVFRELAQYRDNIADKWTYFKRIRGSGCPYLVLPYLTRYNDTERAGATQRRFRDALDNAAEKYCRAAMVSLTVDPDRFESHAKATEAIRDGVTRWMQRESYQLGGRPESVKVVDYQRNGLPHYHVVLFGVDVVGGGPETGEATISSESVRSYWDESAGVGRQVDVRPAYSRGDGEAWILHDDDDGCVSLGYYLGKRIRGLERLANAEPAELFDMVESGDLSVWRHALFWAYEQQYCTVSPSLRPEESDSDSLPAVRLWEYVGTCRFEQMPAQVRDDAVVCRPQPPPD